MVLVFPPNLFYPLFGQKKFKKKECKREADLNTLTRYPNAVTPATNPPPLPPPNPLELSSHIYRKKNTTQIE